MRKSNFTTFVVVLGVVFLKEQRARGGGGGGGGGRLGLGAF